MIQHFPLFFPWCSCLVWATHSCCMPMSMWPSHLYNSTSELHIQREWNTVKPTLAFTKTMKGNALLLKARLTIICAIYNVFCTYNSATLNDKCMFRICSVPGKLEQLYYKTDVLLLLACINEYNIAQLLYHPHVFYILTSFVSIIDFSLQRVSSSEGLSWMQRGVQAGLNIACELRDLLPGFCWSFSSQKAHAVCWMLASKDE